jgi:SAM-dependent methyltransferase
MTTTTARSRLPLLRPGLRRVYALLNWLASRRIFYRRRAPFLSGLSFDEVRFWNRGNEWDAYLPRTRSLVQLEGADILVLGCGRGEETELWSPYKPRSINAVDYFSYEEWAQRPDVQFTQMDVRELGFEDARFDLVVSHALLEHVAGMKEVTAEMRRVLRPGGIAFANFGPLYSAYGGAHYLGAYDHLTMSDEEFEQYLLERDDPYELSEGLFYLRNGMFSRLKMTEYIEIFQNHFDIVRTVLFVDLRGLRYKRANPSEWSALLSRYDERDLLISGATVWLRAV